MAKCIENHNSEHIGSKTFHAIKRNKFFCDTITIGIFLVRVSIVATKHYGKKASCGGKGLSNWHTSRS